MFFYCAISDAERSAMLYPVSAPTWHESRTWGSWRKPFEGWISFNFGKNWCGLHGYWHERSFNRYFNTWSYNSAFLACAAYIFSIMTQSDLREKNSESAQNKLEPVRSSDFCTLLPSVFVFLQQWLGNERPLKDPIWTLEYLTSRWIAHA